jgi:transcription initiation factor IIE alpha subunit
MNKLLIRALKNAFDMRKEDAVGLAQTVEQIFDGNKEIEDMSIDKFQRALLYELLNENLLKIRREEQQEKGKCMRKYYWSFNKPRIVEEAHRKSKKDVYKIYRQIPQHAWMQRINNT